MSLVVRVVSLLCFALSASAQYGWADEQSDDRRPNIIFVLADDLGWTDLGCYGSEYYETPHIDRLAAGGMKFSYGYSCGPNCQPTRAALLSGQYAPRTGIYTVGSRDRFDTSHRPLVPLENVTALALEKITIAEALRDAGYATGMFGKWHLGNGREHHPLEQGFDEAISSNGRHFNFRTSPKVDVPEGTYLADFLTDRAVDFIERHAEEPFFLYLPHFAVHSPWHAKESLIAHFRDKRPAGGHRDPTYAAMIASVDESVGRILDALDELDLAEQTLVIFSSDNGGVGGYADAGVPQARSITDNAPLRGGKGMLYEGGVRVPYVFHWPGRIAAGSVCHEPINSVDLYPTLLDVAGAAPPNDYPLDGTSYLTLLTGDATKLPRRSLYWHFPGYLGSGKNAWRTTPAGAIQEGTWKLLEFFEDGRLELYNLANDVGQRANLVDSESQRARVMYERLVAWRGEIGAQMPERRERAAQSESHAPSVASQVTR